ncbi:sodium:solute symporter [Virgibacillus byunsanensis]|uniref:Sodium:solute symporter n=1 Tax=Virgibacillus byunsanensis TaxID=570945 RepID=A0ABW3LIL9_9BACI
MSNSLYIIPAIYLIVMVIVGIIVSKRQETRSDFYVASNKMNSGVLFATIFSTVVGANTYMGFSGMVYTGGFSMAWILVAAGSSYFLLFFISGKIRRIAQTHNVFTLPDLMELRYNRPVALLTTAFSLFALVGGAGGSILGVGVILNTILGIDTTIAILITAIVTILYTTLGGLMGVALTDWIQSIIMIVGLILVVALGMSALVPDSGVISSSFQITDVLSRVVGSDFLSLTEGMTFVMVLAWVITFMPLNTISQTQIQRIYAAKSEQSIQRTSLVMVLFVGLFTAFALALVGILGKSIIPDIGNPETVFPMMAMEVINPFMGMIIVTGILGACMSTVDSNLLGAGIHVSRDLYERQRKGAGKEVQEKSSIVVTRWTIVIIGVLSTVAAIMTPSIMELLLTTLGLFAGGTFAPILFGLYWRRANAAGAAAGIILGGLTTIISVIAQTALDPVIIGILFSITGTVIGSLVTKEDFEKGDVFQFKSVASKDLKFLGVISVFFVLFLLGMMNLNTWPYLILITLVALTLSIVLLIIYIFPKSKGA